MTCTWTYDDGRVCGKPADAFRVQWLPKKREWWYCPVHIAALRRRTSDEEAWAQYQVATYPVALR